MRKNNLKILIITVIICLLPMLLGIVLYNDMPDYMAIHFNINSMPDNYASKNLVLFGLPLIMAFFQCFCLIVTNIYNKSNEKFPKVIKVFYWFIPLLTVVIYLLTISFSFGLKTYIGKTVCLVLGMMFIIIGNYMPKISFDTGKYLFHPRINDEKIFRKVVRIMGYSFIILGIVLLILMLFV